jgi:hypothetical protein
MHHRITAFLFLLSLAHSLEVNGTLIQIVGITPDLPTDSANLHTRNIMPTFKSYAPVQPYSNDVIYNGNGQYKKPTCDRSCYNYGDPEIKIMVLDVYNWISPNDVICDKVSPKWNESAVDVKIVEKGKRRTGEILYDPVVRYYSNSPQMICETIAAPECPPKKRYLIANRFGCERVQEEDGKIQYYWLTQPLTDYIEKMINMKVIVK